jgi:hypothetical protein
VTTAAQAGPTPQPRRPRTGRGRAADRPEGLYEPNELVNETPTGFEVTVFGEDDRHRTFNFKTLPLPAWHQQLANAFARCTGPQGKLRTISSAATTYWSFRRLMATLDGMADPPATLADLTVHHLERYWFQRRAEIKQRLLHHEVWAVRSVLEQLPPGLIVEDVDAWLHRRLPAGEIPTVPGYSDREFDAIMAAARSEVAAIRTRLNHGQRLLTRYAQEPDSLSGPDRELAAVLADIAVTGAVPESGHPWQPWDNHPMMQLAQHLFVTDFDLGPLVTLAVGLSGRNSETIKNLTVKHDVLEDKAVRVELVKRRRGPSRMFETVHWEIGTSSQQLRLPGGYYLLLEEMMRLGRSFSGTSSLWSVWNPRRGHYGAFDVAIHLKDWHMGRWKKRHPLLDDDGQPLQIAFPRLKKTVDIRNTRAAGGHLPSSIRSNTMPVLFTNYLRGDPSVQDWAGQVITAALADAETEAYACHARVLAAETKTPEDVAAKLELTTTTANNLLAGELDTAFAACADIDHSPLNQGQRCTASFMMCFGCQNALVTHGHILKLKALLDWLIDQRNKIDLDLWWRQYGLTWLAITEHIRPKFTPAEWDQAQPVDGLPQLMALLDGPQEPQ